MGFFDSKVKWTLRDKMSVDLATGINGTTCDSGHLRTVVDTNACMSIYNGYLYAAPALSAAGNPGIWYPSMSRVAGQSMFFYVRKNTINTSFPRIGWSTSQSGSTVVSGISFGSDGNFYSMNGTGLVIIPASYAADTDYYLCLTQKGTGHYIYIKGGAWTNWTLLFWEAITSTTTLYPAILPTYTQANNFPKIRFYGIAPNIFPVPVASDAFTRTGAINTTVTDGGGDTELGVHGDGVQWSNVLGTVATSSGHVVATATANDGASPTPGSGAFAIVNTGVQDRLQSIKVTQTTQSGGMIIKWLNSANYVSLYYSGGGPYPKVRQVVNGTMTSQTGTTAYSAGALLQGYCIGNQLYVYYNGVYQFTWTIDSSLVSNTNAGVVLWSTSNVYCDDFTVFDLTKNYNYLLDKYIINPTPNIMLTNSLIGGTTARKVAAHTHSYPDSTDTLTSQLPSLVMNAYKNAGFDAVCLTEHNVTPHTPGDYGITWIPGNEETTNAEPTHGHHIGNLNAYLNIVGAVSIQDTITGILAQQGAPTAGDSKPKIACINHPNAVTKALEYTVAQVVQATGYTLIEIYNAIADKNHPEGYATAIVNAALYRGKQFYLNAVDDCHDITDSTQFNKGWDMVYAASTSAADIIAAYLAGNFYPTQGPTIAVVKSGALITVTTPDQATIAFTGGKLGGGVSLATPATNATTNSYTCDGTEICVLATVTRNDGLIAWSQAIWVHT